MPEKNDKNLLRIASVINSAKKTLGIHKCEYDKHITVKSRTRNVISPSFS